MQYFNVIPLDHSPGPAEVLMLDETSVLYVADRLGGSGASVFEGGNYRFSIRKHPNAGFWTIFQESK